MQNNSPEVTPVNPDNAAPQTPASAQPTPVEPSNPTLAPETPVEPPRPIKPKSKKKLIAIITSCVVALALIISGVTFAILHNLPEKVLFDAVSGFLNAKNIELNGKFKIKNTSESSDLDSIDLDFSGATSGVANSAAATATMNFKDSKSYSVTIDETFTDDGILYLKISNLKQTLDQMAANGDLGYYESFETYFGDLIGEIDGDWWKISVDTVLDGFEDMISETDKSKYSATYQCVFDKIKTAANQNDQYAKLYGENSFLSAEKYDPTDTKSGLDISNFTNSGDLYKLSFDTRKMTDFLNGARNIIDADSIAACFDNVTTIETSNIEREDVEDLIDNLPEIVLSIKGWNHELQGVYLTKTIEEGTEVDCYEMNEDCINAQSNTNSQTAFDTYINFNYPTELNISAPGNTKSTADVIKKAIQDFQTMFIDSFGTGTDIDVDTDDTWTTDDDDIIIIDDDEDAYIEDADDDWSNDWSTDDE